MEHAERVHFKVSGAVQGVGFRQSTAEKAQELGLAGWIKNCPDGRVEGEITGSAAAVTAFLTWCQEGPPTASVDQLEILDRAKDLEMPTSPTFEIRS